MKSMNKLMGFGFFLSSVSVSSYFGSEAFFDFSFFFFYECDLLQFVFFIFLEFLFRIRLDVIQITKFIIRDFERNNGVIYNFII